MFGTFGGSAKTKASLVGNDWVVDGDPLTIYKIMQNFPLAKKSKGKAIIPATPEQSRDLAWFRTRYPIEFDREIHFRKLVAARLETEAKVGRILSAEYQPSEIKLADGEEARPYQLQAASLWRASKSLLVADGLGLGKTVTAIAGIAAKEMLPAVIVVPNAIAGQWERQINRFLHKVKVHTITGIHPYDLQTMVICPSCVENVSVKPESGRAHMRCPKCKALMSAKIRRMLPDIVIAPYTRISNWGGILGKFCKSVVFDEVQELRREESLKSQAAYEIAEGATYRMGLSGTPIMNYGGELYNVMKGINPEMLGSVDAFRKTWCTSDSGKWVLSDPEAIGSYLKREGVMIRRTRKDIGQDATKPLIITQSVDADLDAYKEVKDRAGQLANFLLNGAKSARGDAMRAAGEFDQLMRQSTGLSKAPFVAEFVEMLLEQDIPVVLFGWHRSVYDVWASKLGKYSPAFHTGEESARQKEAAIHRFCVTKDTPLFICSLRSGATGLDGLQFRSSTVVLGELDWTPAIISQAIGRVDRDGQVDPVTAYCLVSDFGTDPYMSEVLGIKQQQCDGILGISQAPTRKVDTTEVIRNLARAYLSKT